MRRNGPDGEALPPDKAHVFGNAMRGARDRDFKRAWERALLEDPRGEASVRRESHWRGQARPDESRPPIWWRSAARRFRSIDLHFHDLAAGSRLTLARCRHAARIASRSWLGHANISQTSTYL